MPVESAADRLALLSDFGVTVTWTGTSFIGIFDDEYNGPDLGGGVGFSTSSPRLHCRTADIASVTRGTALTIESVSYKVRDIQNDGTGMTDLVLEKQ